jgi:parallel beta-helix repeat protein
MSRKFVLILCLLILSSCLLSTRLSLVEVKASSSYPVHNVNTGLNYKTIQGAINDPKTLDGDIIFVESGTYYEHVVLNKSLSLFGENRSNTFIDGGGIGKVVTISANNTRIRGFNIRGAGFTPWGSDSGIYLRSSNNIVFNNTITENGDWGIWLDSSSGNNTIAGNSITDNWRGCMLNYTWCNSLVGNRMTNQSDCIYLWGSFNNIIVSNIISENGLGIGFDSSNSNNVTGNNITSNFYGITLLSSFNNTLRSNVLDNNSYGFEVSGFLYLDNQLSYFIQDIDDSNTINGKPVCYWVNHNNEQVASDAGYVALVNCTNITVKDLNLKNNFQGMVLAFTNNSRIQNLNITNNDHGIYLYRSCNNIIRNSYLSNNQVGISLESSSENNIVYNNVTKAQEGVLLSDSSSNNITNNNIANNKYRGVLIGLSYENNIAYNNVTGNGMAGIGISSDGKGTLEKNLVQGNDLINNTCGVQLGDTSGNKCYHNNFVNNTTQASVQVSIGSVSYGNVWDNGYPSGGNYWSDYNGTDLLSGPLQNETGADGIGDSMYNRDHYPLMGMFSDFNATPEYHVQIICNSTISGFQFNGTAISFDVTGNNGTTGFCRIRIPTSLMNGAYNVFVNGTEVSYRMLSSSNETYGYLYFAYTHSTQEVIIIPEFPSFFILPLFMIPTLLAIKIYRKRLIIRQREP